MALADDPEAINPFGKKAKVREDARPGYVELSDGTVKPGSLFLTREARLRIYDETLQRQRDVPLTAIRKIECSVAKEWLEKEWRFKEAANDEKVFTGRSYPAREYLHTITLSDGRTIKGPLAGIVYVQADADHKAERFLLHKRDKGELDQSLTALLYVRKIELGDEALAEGKKRAEEQARQVGSEKKQGESEKNRSESEKKSSAVYAEGVESHRPGLLAQRATLGCSVKRPMYPEGVPSSWDGG